MVTDAPRARENVPGVPDDAKRALKSFIPFDDKRKLKDTLIATADEAVSYTHLTLPTNREV